LEKCLKPSNLGAEAAPISERAGLRTTEILVFSLKFFLRRRSEFLHENEAKTGCLLWNWSTKTLTKTLREFGFESWKNC
jgi:hypothetical protein